MRASNMTFTPENIAAALVTLSEKVDLDGDGLISEEEFDKDQKRFDKAKRDEL